MLTVAFKKNFSFLQHFIFWLLELFFIFPRNCFCSSVSLVDRLKQLQTKRPLVFYMSVTLEIDVLAEKETRKKKYFCRNYKQRQGGRKLLKKKENVLLASMIIAGRWFCCSIMSILMSGFWWSDSYGCIYCQQIDAWSVFSTRNWWFSGCWFEI